MCASTARMSTGRVRRSSRDAREADEGGPVAIEGGGGHRAVPRRGTGRARSTHSLASGAPLRQAFGRPVPADHRRREARKPDREALKDRPRDTTGQSRSVAHRGIRGGKRGRTPCVVRFRPLAGPSRDRTLGGYAIRSNPDDHSAAGEAPANMHRTRGSATSEPVGPTARRERPRTTPLRANQCGRTAGVNHLPGAPSPGGDRAEPRPPAASQPRTKDDTSPPRDVCRISPAGRKSLPGRRSGVRPSCARRACAPAWLPPARPGRPGPPRSRR